MGTHWCAARSAIRFSYRYHYPRVERTWRQRGKAVSEDLKERYPKMGLSPHNLWYMKRFYMRYCESDIKVLRSVALIPCAEKDHVEAELTLEEMGKQ